MVLLVSWGGVEGIAYGGVFEIVWDVEIKIKGLVVVF